MGVGEGGGEGEHVNGGGEGRWGRGAWEWGGGGRWGRGAWEWGWGWGVAKMSMRMGVGKGGGEGECNTLLKHGPTWMVYSGETTRNSEWLQTLVHYTLGPLFM
jgi:hypothetical protein